MPVSSLRSTRSTAARGCWLAAAATSEDPPFNDLTQYPMFYAPTLAVHYANAFVPNLFTALGKQPVQARVAVQHLAIPYGGPMPMTCVDRDRGGPDVGRSFRFIRTWYRDYDYLYVARAAAVKSVAKPAAGSGPVQRALFSTRSITAVCCTADRNTKPCLDDRILRPVPVMADFHGVFPYLVSPVDADGTDPHRRARPALRRPHHIRRAWADAARLDRRVRLSQQRAARRGGADHDRSRARAACRSSPASPRPRPRMRWRRRRPIRSSAPTASSPFWKRIFRSPMRRSNPIFAPSPTRSIFPS